MIDDSAVVRQMLSDPPPRELPHGLGGPEPLIALDKMQSFRPDVIVLDLEMPGMDGLSFLQTVMARDPIPVVVCSGLAARGTEAALRAIEAGAVAVIEKPRLGVKGFLHDSAILIRDTVMAAASGARAAPGSAPASARAGSRGADARARRCTTTTDKVIALGASTGGHGGAARRSWKRCPRTRRAFWSCSTCPRASRARSPSASTGPAASR